jgi:signal transduction histidine kinase
MSLRTRLAVIVLAVAAILSALYGAIYLQLVQPGFDRLEQAEAERDLRRVREAVQREVDDLDLMAADWADWDDTYSFVLDRNEAYRTSNLVPTLFSQIRIHLLVMLDRQGRIVWSGMVDPDDGKPMNLPLFSGDRLPSDHPLLREGGHADPLSGLLSTPHGPMLLSVRPIRYSDQSGPGAGTLLMGRFLGGRVADNLARLTQLPLAIQSLEAAQIEDPDTVARLDLDHPTVLTPMAEGGLRGQVLFADLFNRPMLVLRADLPHDLSDSARMTLLWALGAAAGGGLLVLAVLLGGLGGTVVQPLGRLARHVAVLHETGDLSARLGPQETQEMTVLAAAIDQLAERLETADVERDRAQHQLLDGVEGVVDGFALWDAEDRLVLCNEPYRRGLPAIADLIVPGARFADLAAAVAERGQVHHTAASTAEWVAGRVDHHRKPAAPFEYPLSDGRWLEIRERRTREGGIVGIYTDITRRKLAEDQLRRMVMELERSNTDLEQFAYVASHDLQEPLRQVSSYAQLLERRYGEALGDDGHEFIRYLTDGARRMQSQISDLLSYARVNQQERPFGDVDTAEVLRATLAQLHATIAAAGAEVRSGPLPSVQGDRAMLVQLFQNLIGNAVKYAKVDLAPQVTIAAERQDGAWRFSVGDNGIGMDPADAGRIFGIFTRLHSRADYDGTGIGLAICKRIVERHGGTIWVETAPGQGSTFFFTLSATADKVAEQTAAAEAES